MESITCAVNMNDSMNSDNIYPIGTVITAKDDSTLQLMIRKYYQRIYYCSVLGDKTRKDMVYFENELIAPTLS